MMKLTTALFMAAVGALACAGVVLAGGPATTPAGDAGKVADVGVQVQLSKQQFESLVILMNKVADNLQASDPESSKAIRAAVASAQEAFLANKMGEVYDALFKSLSEANAKSQNVEAILDEVLRILKEGAIDRKNSDEYGDFLKKTLENVEQAIRDQKAAEQKLKDQMNPLSKEMEAILKELEAVIKEQENLLKETTKLSDADAQAKKLSDLRDALGKLIAEQEKLNDATVAASISQRACLAPIQDTLNDATKAVQDKLNEAASDSKLIDAMEKSGAPKDSLSKAAQSTGQASAEMGKASDALGKSDDKKAGASQEQATLDLKAARKALEDAIAKTPSGSIADKQNQLADKTDELAGAAKSLGDIAGKAASQPTSTPDAASQSGGDKSQANKIDPRNISDAAQEMSNASDSLNRQDRAQAVESQKKALEKLNGNRATLAQLLRKEQEKPKIDPAQTRKSQDKVTEKTEQIAKDMKDQGEKSGQKTPGQDSVGKASKSSKNASEKMSQDKPADANEEQQKTLEELEKAREDLQEAVDKEEDQKEEEKLAKIDEMLSNILEEQRKLSAATKVTYDKRKGDGQYDRKGEQDLAALSTGEGGLSKEIGKVRAMLKKEDKTVVFPEILKEVNANLDEVQKKLSDKDAGMLTQTTQFEIEKSLESLVKAVRDKRIEHLTKKKGGGGGGGDGNSMGGPRAPLIPPLAELKMLKGLQDQVNDRTVLVNKQTANLPKEVIEAEHKQLAEKEKKIVEMAETISNRGSKPQQ